MYLGDSRSTQLKPPNWIEGSTSNLQSEPSLFPKHVSSHVSPENFPVSDNMQRGKCAVSADLSGLFWHFLLSVAAPLYWRLYYAATLYWDGNISISLLPSGICLYSIKEITARHFVSSIIYEELIRTAQKNWLHLGGSLIFLKGDF